MVNVTPEGTVTEEVMILRPVPSHSWLEARTPERNCSTYLIWTNWFWSKVAPPGTLIPAQSPGTGSELLGRAFSAGQLVAS